MPHTSQADPSSTPRARATLSSSGRSVADKVPHAAHGGRTTICLPVGGRWRPTCCGGGDGLSSRRTRTCYTCDSLHAGNAAPSISLSQGRAGRRYLCRHNHRRHGGDCSDSGAPAAADATRCNTSPLGGIAHPKPLVDTNTAAAIYRAFEHGAHHGSPYHSIAGLRNDQRSSHERGEMRAWVTKGDRQRGGISAFMLPYARSETHRVNSTSSERHSCYRTHSPKRKARPKRPQPARTLAP